MELPIFKAPEGYKNLFEMDDHDIAKYHGITLEQANKISYHIICSMMDNNIARDRESIIENLLSDEEYNDYLETGFFTYEGIKYNSYGEAV